MFQAEETVYAKTWGWREKPRCSQEKNGLKMTQVMQGALPPPGALPPRARTNWEGYLGVYTIGVAIPFLM